MDEMEFTLGITFTEDEIDAITDADCEHTSKITLITKHGKRVDFMKLTSEEWIKKSDAIAALGECPEDDCRAVCDWNRYRDRIQAIQGICMEDDGK